MNDKDQHTDDHADGIVEDRKQAPPIYFNILFFGLIIWGVLFIAYFLLSGWSSQQEFEQKMAAHTATQPPSTQVAPTATVAPAAGESVDADELFAANCAGCHGAEGKGGFGPDLRGQYTYGKSSAAVKASITNGRGGKMPAFADRLSAEQIDTLATYVLQL